MKRTHKLKCWPEPFQAILDGHKRHEIRIDDRGFAQGDELHLVEWDPTGWGEFTKREHRVEVTYLTPGGAWGLPVKLCVMSIRNVQ